MDTAWERRGMCELALMRTARTLEAEWRQVLRGSVSTGAKEGESSIGACLGCWISSCYGPFLAWRTF
jgi:hypothetical protein